MRLIVAGLLLLLTASAKADDKKYAVSAIPAPLLKNANVVKRMEEISFEIISTGEAVYRHKYAVTILNEEGIQSAYLSEYFDKIRKITSIDGTLYGADGQVLKRVKNKDIVDISASDETSLIDDSRRKVHSFNYQYYPYTVEYEVVTKVSTTFKFRPYVPQEDEHFSVEQSRCSVSCPSGYLFRYKAFNFKGEPKMVTEKDRKVYTWEVSNLEAVIQPYASPRWHELTPFVFFAPSDFEIQGYKGNATTWEELGKFQIQLNEGRDKLPEPIAQKARELTEGVTDPKEKIRRLYEYMQQNTRYISIQLGIGGLQPFEASFVAQKGYGDCKALSNYMYSLLKVVGIPSYYTWIQGGKGEEFILEDFPSDQFNHIVLCVPMAKDTMWLECTSQTESAGYMGSFTGNRKALLITETGGKLVSTPRYGLADNTQLRAIKAKVDEQGNLSMDVQTRYRCIQQDRFSYLVNNRSKEEVQKVLQQSFGLSTYDINSFQYTEQKSERPVVEEKLDISVRNYATVSGKRMFIVPNILTKGGNRMDLNPDRKVDYLFRMEWRDEDRVEIEIPAGYTLEATPPEVNLKTKFGTYRYSAKLEGNKIICIRQQEQFAGRFPVTDGAELVKFFNDIYKSDRVKMVLVKRES